MTSSTFLTILIAVLAIIIITFTGAIIINLVYFRDPSFPCSSKYEDMPTGIVITMLFLMMGLIIGGMLFLRKSITNPLLTIWIAIFATTVAIIMIAVIFVVANFERFYPYQTPYDAMNISCLTITMLVFTAIIIAAAMFLWEIPIMALAIMAVVTAVLIAILTFVAGLIIIICGTF